MKYLPSAKSPAWQMIFAAHAFIFAYAVATNVFTFQGDTYPTTLVIPVELIIIAATFIISAIFAYIATNNYNKSHPKGKLSIFQITPPEFNDDDERLAGLTAKATRNVYLYHNTALPVLAIILIFIQPALPLMIIFIGALTMGHYIAYWIGIKPALED